MISKIIKHVFNNIFRTVGILYPSTIREVKSRSFKDDRVNVAAWVDINETSTYNAVQCVD